jgi:hypothetical protein
VSWLNSHYGGGGSSWGLFDALNTKLLFSVLDVVQQHATNTPDNKLWICLVSTHPLLSKQVHDFSAVVVI